MAQLIKNLEQADKLADISIFQREKLLIWPQVLPLFQNSINPFNTKQANKQIIKAEDHVPQKPRDLNFSIANLMFQCVFGYLTFEFGACATPRIPLRFHDQFGASFCLAQINGRQVFLFIFHFWRIIRFIRVFVQLKQPVVSYRRDSPLFLAFFPSLEFCKKSEFSRKRYLYYSFRKAGFSQRRGTRIMIPDHCQDNSLPFSSASNRRTKHP